MLKNNQNILPVLSSEFKASLVRAIETAMHDDTIEIIRNYNLQTRNSIPSLIWDLINTRILATLGPENCIVKTVKRGPWEMVVVFEKNSQCIITFMRESRFKELQRTQNNRKNNMHYLDMLAQVFNYALEGQSQQLSFAPYSPTDNDQVYEMVQNMLQDITEDISIIRNHILVLFDTIGLQLTSIRAVMVTPSLEVAIDCEENWSHYISTAESVIVEKTNPTETPITQPTPQLSLKPKALERRKASSK